MAEKILIIDDDLDTLRLVGLMLQRQGYQIAAAANGQQGLEKAFTENPDLVLLDVMMPDMDGYEVARRLRKQPETANTPILMFTAKTQLDDKVTGFEVGADDYLTKPTHPSELQAHVKALLARATKSTAGPVKELAETSVHENAAFVVGVLSARGGLGVSTLALNLGASLMPKADSEVIVAEFTPGQGTFGLDLGISDTQGLGKLLSSRPADIDRALVKSNLVTHSSGLTLLLASSRPREMLLNNQVKQYEAIVSTLAVQARFVILDLGSGLPAFVQKILSMCHMRIVVVEGVPNVILHTKALLEDMATLGLNKQQTVVVLNNRMRSDTHIHRAKVQEKLGYSISVAFTPAPELYFQAMREQQPAVMIRPESLTYQQFSEISNLVIEHRAEKG
ncbi:MAG: response regulator [Anaerolineales bacterium]|nr:response regulator [Anaerolineales bacterium]